MTPTPEDRLARRIVEHLGQEPEVSDHVAQRLALARKRALSRVPPKQEVVLFANSLAWRVSAGRRRMGLWLALAVMAMYCASLSGPFSKDSNYGWSADDDNSSYVELLRD